MAPAAPISTSTGTIRQRKADDEFAPESRICVRCGRRHLGIRFGFALDDDCRRRWLGWAARSENTPAIVYELFAHKGQTPPSSPADGDCKMQQEFRRGIAV